MNPYVPSIPFITSNRTEDLSSRLNSGIQRELELRKELGLDENVVEEEEIEPLNASISNKEDLTSKKPNEEFAAMNKRKSNRGSF